MEPSLPLPQHSPESRPLPPILPEVAAPFAPEQTPISPEHSQRVEQRSGSGDGAGLSAPVPVAPSPVPVPPVVPAAPTIAPSSNPLTAADEDLIEKEWVERAKKIIGETKHDPYEQERAVSKLQADYLQKRYGKSIKLRDGA